MYRNTIIQGLLMEKVLLLTPARTHSRKWTKISSLEINIFGSKDDGEKWSGNYFEIH